MKNSVFSAAICSVIASSAFAGTSGSPKVTDQPTVRGPFSANETQFDVFGTYLDGKGPFHTGPVKDHAWGGGIGVNQFWTENFGLGIDAGALYGRENPAKGTKDKTFAQGTASLIFRVPYQEYNIAPYGYVGGGITGRNGSWASAHAGIGVEYRIIPNAVGIFTDARWTYYGDAYGHGDLNNFQARAGVRLAF
jgi:hypothetical protein